VDAQPVTARIPDLRAAASRDLAAPLNAGSQRGARRLDARRRAPYTEQAPE
jgi:hypothetical protein